MSAAFQAVNIKAPQGDGVANTNVRRFTVTAASLVNALPDDWAGKYIYLHNESAVDVDFFFTTNAAAAISAATAASNAGAGAATQGGRLRSLGERHVRVPSKAPEQTLYFARICGTTATVRAELASD
jgi:hypothetical protein